MSCCRRRDRTKESPWQLLLTEIRGEREWNKIGNEMTGFSIWQKCLPAVGPIAAHSSPAEASTAPLWVPSSQSLGAQSFCEADVPARPVRPTAVLWMNLGLQMCVSQLFTLNPTPGWSPSQALLPTRLPPSMFQGLVSHFQQVLPFQKVQYSMMPSANYLHFQTIPYSRLISSPIRPVSKTHFQEHAQVFSVLLVLCFSCIQP